jgi:23S rRNA (cytosine1962-C5)-methyltransferase
VSSFPRVTLRKQLARAIRSGQPWIWRDAVAGSPRLPDGAVVMVADAAGRPLARGFWDASSPIAVRVVSALDEEAPAKVIGPRLAEALDRRLGVIDLAETDAFRWVHGEADRLPGIHVDVYGRAVTVRYDGEGARAFYAGLPPLLRSTAAAHDLSIDTLVERRPRSARAEATAAVFGRVPAGEIEVREHGLKFGVDLAHGQKGGLFLDQRENRQWVRTLAAGRRVLNLFGYTGGFSVYAAAGAATSTVTVDLAAPAIEAARRNFVRNGLPLESARFVAGDAFAFLEEAAASGERFDLVVSDPPSFASSRRALDTGLRAYRRLHRLAAAVTAPAGILCAASCSSHVDRATFLDTVREGAAEAGRRFDLRELRTAGPDHPVIPQFPEGDYLKFAVGDVADKAQPGQRDPAKA